MTDDDEDDLESEEFSKLSHKQQEAEINRLMQELSDKLDAMTVPEQVAHHRHFVLESIRKNRRRLKDPKLSRIEVIDDIFRQHIRRAQIRLAKLRHWRETGHYPGEA
jgi:hypothetical protein